MGAGRSGNRARRRERGDEATRIWHSGGEETSGGGLTPWGDRRCETSLGKGEEVVLEGVLAFRTHFGEESWQSTIETYMIVIFRLLS